VSKKKTKTTPDALTSLIQSQAKLKRFLLVGETNDGGALVMCWNGKEYQNQVDMIGLLSLTFRAFVPDRPADTEAAPKPCDAEEAAP
jgi:hypothetical protein